ncbi:PREDICTED: high mobility group protein B3 isoform X2 [Ceratosolen solmsi marchali]|uniref:High mobility group protein B3 isoform X2 n=1 Tax=Ceratosolen solmsi marchali TaxID=326594 RepID=A0AAJ6VMD8_9HYME|nr:PREDICTED: high mobility group protein B3 isoform X2 [Ceratosolen solmsi marchali]
MSIYKFFNLYSYSRLNYTDFFHLSFFFKCNEQQAWISNKQRVEFGLPLPPKKPLTGFFEFAQIRRPELLQTQPHLSQQEIMKLIAKDWHNLNTEQKLLVKNKKMSGTE